MKKLILAILLTVISTSATAEWTLLGSTGTGTNDLEGYFDYSTIRKSGSMVKIWGMRNYRTVQVVLDKRFLSAAIQWEYNCKVETSRVLAFAYYSGNMGKGQMVESNTDAGNTTTHAPIIPNTASKNEWEIACGKK